MPLFVIVLAGVKTLAGLGRIPNVPRIIYVDDSNHAVCSNGDHRNCGVVDILATLPDVSGMTQLGAQVIHKDDEYESDNWGEVVAIWSATRAVQVEWRRSWSMGGRARRFEASWYDFDELFVIPPELFAL